MQRPWQISIFPTKGGGIRIRTQSKVGQKGIEQLSKVLEQFLVEVIGRA
jgi:hypothetical protein